MTNRYPILRPLAFFPIALALTGCALTSTIAPIAASKGLSLHGSVHGGQQPIAGAHIYLLAANNTSYGAPSMSLLFAGTTGYADSVGAYVPTDANGNFDISGDYVCAPNTQVYLYAHGGDAGAGPNSAVGLMAILGNCPNSGNFATAVPYISVNEVSTVAAAYALAPFALDATDVSTSGSALALTGVANAFANASNLVDLPSGTALATTPYGNATVPTATINTLANVLAACINSTGPSDPNCLTLLGEATSDGTPTGTAPTDTATAMINIAHNPGANISDLFNLPLPASPFAPTLSTRPHDFTIALTYTGNSINAPGSVSVDASGNVWIANWGNASVTVLSSLGIPTYNSPLLNNGLANPSQIAIDQNGNAWVADASSNVISEFDLNGNVVSGSPFTNGTSNSAGAIAIDPSGNVWAPSAGDNELSFFSMASTPSLLQLTGNGLNSPDSVAFDSAGNAWVVNQSGNTASVFDSAGAPFTQISGFSIAAPTALAVDNYGYAWIGDYNNNQISVVNASSQAMANSPFSGGGLSQPLAIAFDGVGNAWVANNGGGVTAFTSTGTVIAGSPFNVAASPNSRFLAVDGSGSVWIAEQGTSSVVELIGSAAPAVTPIASAVTNGTVGTLP